MFKKINKIALLSSCILFMQAGAMALDAGQDAVQTGAKVEKLPIKIMGEMNVNQTQKEPEKTKIKLFGKKKVDYSEYLIPTEGYIPIGNAHQKPEIVEGSVSKGAEFNLADCLELAIANNPKIKAAYANAAAVKTKRGQTISRYTPNLTWTSSIARNKNDVTSSASAVNASAYTKYLYGSIGVSQLVYDFGNVQNQYTIDKLNYQDSTDNIDEVVNEVIYQVKDAYYYVILALENKRVIQETVEQFEQTYNQALAFYQVGAKEKIGVTMAEVDLEDARAQLIQANYAVDVAISRLNNIMGLPFISPYTIDSKLPFEDIKLSIQEAVEIANKERPRLKMALTKVKIADEYVKLAKKTFLPRIEVQGNFSAGQRDDMDSKNWYNVGGFLSFPTVNPVLIKNQIDEARFAYEQQQHSTRAEINDIYYEIQQTYAKLLEKKERVPVAKKGVQKAYENYQIARGRYRVGLSDPIELKSAQLDLLNARLAYLETLYQYNNAKSVLEKSIGQTLRGEDMGAELVIPKEETPADFMENSKI